MSSSLPSEPRLDSTKKKYRIPYNQSSSRAATEALLHSARLPTVCEEAKCPNRIECFSKKRATFLALGKECTRSCRFCDIHFSKSPRPLDPEEPQQIALSAKALGLEHVVITMVARDDLEDGGALQMTKIVEAVRQTIPSATLELLTSDFEGKEEALKQIFESKPDIFNYNIETVRRLTPKIRHRATYERTLWILEKASSSGLCTKSGIMVGLGETDEEIEATLIDLRRHGCSIITIGQYLQPSKKKLSVSKLYSIEEFHSLERLALRIGFEEAYAGPFVRSSYNAKEVYESRRLRSV